MGISAYEIEEFVRATLSGGSWELADQAMTLQMHEFATAWRLLDERRQSAALSEVLKEVRFDPHGGSIALTLAENALNRLRRQ